MELYSLLVIWMFSYGFLLNPDIAKYWQYFLRSPDIIWEKSGSKIKRDYIRFKTI